MVKGVFIFFTFIFLIFNNHGKAQTAFIIPDTTSISKNKLNNYNYSWEKRDLKPSHISKNTGIVEVPIDTFNSVVFHKQTHTFIFDTLLTLNWRRDSALQKIIKFPMPEKVEKPRYKDFAIADIQYIDVDQGISSSYILSVFEDSRHALWFGTYEGGLIRYNGYSMYNFTVDNGMPGSSIRSISEDNDGNMWFGTAGNGFCMFDGHTITNFGLIPELKDLYVMDIAQDERGKLWVATKKKGVFVITDSHILHLDTQNHLPSNTINTMETDDGNKVWLGTKNGIAIVQNDSIVNITFEGEGNFNIVKAFQRVDSNHIWVGTNKSALIYSNGIFREVNIHVSVKSFITDDNGSLWIATVNEGLFQVDMEFDSIWTGSYKRYTEAHGLSNNYISALVYSRGYLWMGTYGGGVNKLKTEGFNHITKNQGIRSDLVWGFLEDNQHNLWMATELDGICKFEDSLYYHFSKDSLVVNNKIFLSAYSDEKNAMYFGSYKGGVYKITNDSLYKLNIEGVQHPLSVISIMQDRNQNLWLGTYERGVFKVEKDKITQYNTHTGILNNDVYDIYADEFGKIW